MKRLAWLFLLAACGDNLVTDDGGGGGELVAELRSRLVATFAPEVQPAAMIALDTQRLAIARIERSGVAFCPDCTTLEPSQCPAACERTQVSVAVLDIAGGALGDTRPVATVFPASFDHSVDQVQLVALGGDRVGVAWLDCDNARCNGLFASRSCTARYTTLELATGATGAVHVLYEGWFGDLSLAFEPETRRLLALVGKDLAMGTGIFREVRDETAATVLSPWAPLGSSAARSPTILAHGGTLVVVADDWSPARAPLATPCTQSCDCLDAGPIDIDAGGLFAFHIGAGGDVVERVASGRDKRGFYGRREQIAVIDAGGKPMIAATQSIDRLAEIFIYEGAAWRVALESPAPIPLWVGALGTADRLAWLGARPEPGEQATVQRLAAGIVAGSASEHATFTEPADRSVFSAVPAQTHDGVRTAYLLQGLFARTGGGLAWERFEILAIGWD